MAEPDRPITPPPGGLVTRTCTLWPEAGVMRARFHEGADVSLEDARENLAATARLTAGHRALALIDLRPVRTQSPEARALFAGPEAAKVSQAVALLIGSPLSRVLGNFYLRFNRPETPTRLFSSEAEALGWLVSIGAGGDPGSGTVGGA
jgi:hypothetical protein